MKHIGLFEGIGGFSLAAEWMGWETIAWCEWNEFCQKILKHHFPKAKQHGDITKTDFTIYRGKCNILTGGFPCQPYSHAGKRLGKADDRHLWPEMLRAIREIQPTWVVGENVSGLVSWNGGMVFNEVQADLEAEGYEVIPFILPACAVNAPHRRDRVWFIAHSNRSRSKKSAVQQSNVFTESGGLGEDERPFTNAASVRCNGNDAADTNITGWGKKCQPTAKSNKQERQYSKKDFENQPGSWQNFPIEPPVCSRNDGLSNRLDGITFPKWRNESIKAYGNAIVPQVALQIYKAIEQYEKLITNQPTGANNDV